MNRPTNKIRKGDTVIIIAGSAKGKTGKVMAFNKETNQVQVEGVKKVTKHVKPTGINSVGGIEKKDAWINVSNTALTDDKKKAVRTGFSIKDGKKSRVMIQANRKEVK